MAQLTSDLKSRLKNKGMEEPLINLKSGSGMFTPGGSSNENSTNTRGEVKRNSRLPTIDFPHFEGEGPREWLRKARKYLQLHQILN